MSAPKVQELLSKARELAINGEYSSSLVYYEECQAVFERIYGNTLLPSQKRLYDVLLAEMSELREIIKEIDILRGMNVSSANPVLPGFKSIDVNPPQPNSQRKPTKNPSSPLQPRFTVDERGHRLPAISPIKTRMTVPVRRQSIMAVKPHEPLSPSQPAQPLSNSNPSECNNSIQFDNPKTQAFVQQYKGVLDVDLVRMLEAEVIDHSPNVTWDRIAGLSQAREVLEEAFILPQWMPDLFQGIRRPWKGILLFGPPGTGKTLLAKAIATECNTTFFNVTSSTLTSKWRGDSEKLVKLLFEMARFYAPSTVFIDEVDALGGQRGNQGDNEASLRVKSELLIQMDGVDSSSQGSVTVLGATNLPWNLDEALRRRFEKRIYIPLPEAEQRQELFGISLKGVDVHEDVHFEELAELTNGYSGADIANVCRDASMMPIRALMQQLRQNGVSGEELQRILRDKETNLKATPVTQNDLKTAIQKISSSVGTTDIRKFENWMKDYGST